MRARAQRSGLRDVVVGALVSIVCAVGVLAYLISDRHALHDPIHALQQLDLLYLDQPAPGYRALGLQRGRPALVAFCRDCRAPAVSAQVRISERRDLALAYGLVTADGRLGPGYALIDPTGNVRYRTFDPGLADHGEEIEVLLGAIR